jgi:uncharacterized membrane protein
MTVLASIIAAYALAVLALPSFGPPFVRDRRATVPIALYAHLAGGALALGIGPWQFNTRLRDRAVKVHRWMGRSYVVAVLVGGVGALALATLSQEGLVTHAGFGLLAVLWLTTTLQAYRHIRRRHLEVHREWMMRSYSLTFAAVTLRIYLVVSEVMGIPFEEAYQAISWLCWVPNLVVAEWWFVTCARGMRLTGSEVAPGAGR